MMLTGLHYRGTGSGVEMEFSIKPVGSYTLEEWDFYKFLNRWEDKM